MKIGLIGVGTVGGTLKRYFEEFTSHDIKLYDPQKGMNDDLTGIEAAFISVPVPAHYKGQDKSLLETAINQAKMYTDLVFIRSTVLPGTNDSYGTISMPEFLTERIAFEEMKRLPIICGKTSFDIKKIFPDKEIRYMSNNEAELTKMAHNCFGAMKVTYFNLIYDLCQSFDCDFYKVKSNMGMTGFIDLENHTQVPGPDGQRGFGGKCFPENISAMHKMLSSMNGWDKESDLFSVIKSLNYMQRNYGYTRKGNDA